MYKIEHILTTICFNFFENIIIFINRKSFLWDKLFESGQVNFLKAVFHKIYLLCPISTTENCINYKYQNFINQLLAQVLEAEREPPLTYQGTCNFWKIIEGGDQDIFVKKRGSHIKRLFVKEVEALVSVNNVRIL